MQTTMTKGLAGYLTPPLLAARWGLAVWQARRLADLFRSEVPTVSNGTRLIPESLLPKLRAEAVKRGWLPAEGGAVLEEDDV
jgi:hypothetical protein